MCQICLLGPWMVRYHRMNLTMRMVRNCVVVDSSVRKLLADCLESNPQVRLRTMSQWPHLSLLQQQQAFRTVCPPPPSILDDSAVAAVLDTALLDTALQATKRRRIRASYAKKFFYGEPDMYLDIDPTKETAESTPELLGQVKTCPNKKKQNLYEISWIRPKDPMVQWPENLKYHLRTLFHKNEIHKRLSSLIDGCILNRDLAAATVSLPTQRDMERTKHFRV